MGCSTEGVCETCKQVHYFGYGPYSTSPGIYGTDGLTPIQEFNKDLERALDKLVEQNPHDYSERPDPPRYARVREFLKEHGDHKVSVWCGDASEFETRDGRDLIVRNCMDYAPMYDITGWKRVDWDPAT